MASFPVLTRSRLKHHARSVPQFVAPMLLEPGETLPVGEAWLYELKWDGFRCIATKHGNNVRLWSRNMNDLGDKFPEVLHAILQLPVFSATLDGEIVALDEEGRPCFQRLQNGSREGCHICFYAFDLLNVDGQNTLHWPLHARKEVLRQVVEGSRVRFSASLVGSPKALLREIAARKLEGLVAKRRDSLYEPGKRSGSWRKFKVLQEGEFLIGGYRPCDRSFDCVLVGEMREDGLHFVGKVQAGFTSRMRQGLLSKISKAVVNRCPFVNLPQRTRGRWHDEINADDMRSYRWLHRSVKIQVGFVERTDAGLLTHPRITSP
jgi:bifunctional non-homologous end joining protein LigD